MINFRYHVVSLTAVFLALAVGLVLGTAALNGTLTDNLNDQVGALRKSNEQLRGQVRQLDAAANNKEDFDRQLAPVVLKGTLTDKRVLVVRMPDSDPKQAEGVQQMLGYAGARSTGQLQVTRTFTDPTHSDGLSDLSTTKLPTDVHTTLPNNGNGPESASALLATVLLDGKSAVSTDSRTIVLSAFSTDRDVVEEQKVSGPAQAVVIMAGPPATDKDAVKRNAALLTLVKQFSKVAPTVVVGPGTAGDGNLITAVRGDSTLSALVSTVDNVNLVQGQMTTVLALPERLAGRANQYGTGEGAKAVMPKPGS